MPHPNQQQPEQKQPHGQNRPANEDQELKPIDYEDVPPPVIKANTEGEGDDAAAGFQGDEAERLVEQEHGGENQGEGNRDADRNYRRGVKQHLKKGNVEQEAKEAANALDDEDERQRLEDAEEAGRKGRTLH